MRGTFKGELFGYIGFRASQYEGLSVTRIYSDVGFGNQPSIRASETTTV